jgi:YebC/PmpR family DNA-binding regulatory protein
MSGHSKWANIKRRKGVEDAKKGKVFAKLARELTIAAKEGGGDINANPTLRSVFEKARAENMPKDRIENAIARGTGALSGSSIEAVYEGYGLGGVAFLITVVTDNKNRTVSEIRGIFNRHGGSLADAGSVSYLFAGTPPVAKYKIPLSPDSRGSFEQLKEALEENDDVVMVVHNCEI